MHNAQQKQQTADRRGFSWGVNKPAIRLTSDANNFKKVMLKAMLERKLCLQGIFWLEHETNTCTAVRLSLKSLNGSK